MNISHKSFGKTDVGLVREKNEDTLFMDKENGIYVVCDGMGGHSAGEVASQTTVNLFKTVFDNYQKELLEEDNLLPITETLPPKGNLLLKIIRLANRSIYRQAIDNSSQSGMGTTVAAVALEDDFISIAHVGDSRIYLLNETGLKPLTEDHSFIVEAQKTSDMTEKELSKIYGKNVITRALGVKDTVQIDYSLHKLNKSDRLILCSDGLCGFATDKEIFDTTVKNNKNLESIVNSLIKLAIDKGGKDNVTVVGVEITDLIKTVQEPIEPFTIEDESPETLSRSDHWLQMIMTNSDSDKNDSKKDSGPNKFLLFSIFAAFIIIAATIIYISGNK